VVACLWLGDNIAILSMEKQARLFYSNTKYEHTNRSKVKQLDIVEDLLDKDRTMEAIVRQGWTLALVLGVGWSDRDVNSKY
jgi:hypothetical protein